MCVMGSHVHITVLLLVVQESNFYFHAAASHPKGLTSGA